MKLPFGFEIEIKKKGAGRKNRFVGRILDKWFYGRELATSMDYSSLVSAYRGWVYVCAQRNATTLASIPLKLYLAKDTPREIKGYRTKTLSKKQRAFLEKNAGIAHLPSVRKSVELVEITTHPFLDLLNNVNNFMNRFALWEITELYQELCGNAYWHIVTAPIKSGVEIPVEIWPLPAQHVKIIPDPEKFISGYEYRSGINKVTFKEKEVIHFKFPNPSSYYYGISPLAANAGTYNIAKAMDEYESAVFANMGRLEGAFETEQPVSDAEFERIKEEIKAFQGAKNAGKSPFLDKGITYKSYSFSPREMSFLQGRKAVKEQICNAYGQSLALYDKESNRANAEMALYSYMLNTIRPRCIRIEEKINEKFLPYYDERLFVAFDNCVPADKEYRLKELEVHLRTGYSSINQERQIDNREEVPWGDVPYLPDNMSKIQGKEDKDKANNARGERG